MNDEQQEYQPPPMPRRVGERLARMTVAVLRRRWPWPTLPPDEVVAVVVEETLKRDPWYGEHYDEEPDHELGLEVAAVIRTTLQDADGEGS